MKHYVPNQNSDNMIITGITQKSKVPPEGFEVVTTIDHL